MVVVEGGKCPTPCKREGKLSGKEKFPGGALCPAYCVLGEMS